jgi:hypothetical protein
MPTVPTEKPFEQKPATNAKKGESAKPQPNSQPPDLAALIDAITTEGRIYRAEKREDCGSSVREWITIGVITSSLIAVWWQVHEMIKVYEPIKDSADAAKTSADAARRSVDVAEDGVRAWIAPTNFSFVDLNNANDPLRVRVSYQNVGREPAIKVKNRSPSAIITNVTEQWGTLSNWHEEMFKPENICVDMNKTDVTSVVYQTTNVSAEIYIPTFDKMDRSTLLTRVK